MRVLLLCFAALISASCSAQKTWVQEMLAEVRTDSLMTIVRELAGDTPVVIGQVTDTIFSRHANYPGNDLTRQFLKQKLQSYGLQVTEQPGPQASCVNVFAIQPGTLYPNERYVICAHYDNMPNAPVNHGADDNASGVAAVLEAARIMSKRSFPYSVIYALWDEEEQIMVGSSFFVNTYNQGTFPIHGVLNLDMIGWDGDSDRQANIHVRNIAQSLQLDTKLREANTEYQTGLTLNTINPGTDASDHRPFWNQFISAVLFIEEDITDENPFYHSLEDKTFHLDQDYFTRMSKLALAALAELAGDSTGVGMPERDEHSTLHVHPNPAHSELLIHVDGSNEAQVRCHGSDGREWVLRPSPRAPGTIELKLDELMPPGLYQLVVTGGERKRIARFIKM